MSPSCLEWPALQLIAVRPPAATRSSGSLQLESERSLSLVAAERSTVPPEALTPQQQQRQ